MIFVSRNHGTAWVGFFVGLAATAIIAFATSMALVVPVGILASLLVGYAVHRRAHRDPLADEDGGR